MNLVLTTFPQERSGNVGDLLITNSFIELARSIGAISNYEMRFRTTNLDAPDIEVFRNLPIFLPGMSIAHSSYPDLYTLTEDVENLPLGLIPFGCTWQHPIGNIEDAARATISDKFTRVLHTIAERTGPIAVRDHVAESILMRAAIPAITVGDCGWYHLPSHGLPMRRPLEIFKVAVTTPHNPLLADQSRALTTLLRRLWPEAELRLVLHSKPLAHVMEISEHAARHGFQIVEAAGKPEIFDEYSSYDLHVGHRLHGHIGFIRRRIPSVLLMEDARSKGFSSSIPTGCFSAFSSVLPSEALADITPKKAMTYQRADMAVLDRVEDFINQELRTGFARFEGVAGYLDRMLHQVALPELRRKFDAANSALGITPYLISDET